METSQATLALVLMLTLRFCYAQASGHLRRKAPNQRDKRPFPVSLIRSTQQQHMSSLTEVFSRCEDEARCLVVGGFFSLFFF